MRPRNLTITTSLALVVGLIVAMFVAMSAQAGSALTVDDLTGALEPSDLANDLVGEGIAISNVTYTGDEAAGGEFTGAANIIGFGSGVILSSGAVSSVVGPNVDDSITTSFGSAGDTDLEALSGFETFDASVLEFDFVPNTDAVAFQYVFASDEYNEYVNTEFNDVFAFFINGENCAMVDSDPVSVNTINNGNPDTGEDPTPSHAELYRNNDLDDGGGSINTEMDGLTTVLTCQSAATPGTTNHMKLAIADASDESYDSAVFLQAGSFVAVVPPTSTATATEEPEPTATEESIQLPPTGGPTSGSADSDSLVGFAALGALGLAGALAAGYALMKGRAG
ncbi:MAG: choice-of-anchor L domain-containing protein [Dehalococcoidia bacterium]